jgi:hypothetical protein
MWMLSPQVASAAKPVTLSVDGIKNGKSAMVHFNYPAFKGKKVTVYASSSWKTTPEGVKPPKTKDRYMWLRTERHSDTAAITLDAAGNGAIRINGMPKNKMVSVFVKLKHRIPGGKTSEYSKEFRFSMR